ncbi:PSP1-domain-containing protein, partial [Tilletiaria anomala UBC 951]
DAGPASLQELGKGVPLQALPGEMPLYIVEFKQGRTDLYFKQQWATHDDFDVCKGDLVVVEADRGKDLGTVVNDSINVAQVQSFLVHQNGMRGAAGASAGASDSKVRLISPKRLYGRATPADTALLYSKAQDEERALQLCVTKVTQRGLPMSVIAAEMQWDRRKLTFYYTANVRVDFRDLVKELFRLYKTR